MTPATGGGWDTGKVPLDICPDPSAHVRVSAASGEGTLREALRRLHDPENVPPDMMPPYYVGWHRAIEAALAALREGSGAIDAADQYERGWLAGAAKAEHDAAGAIDAGRLAEAMANADIPLGYGLPDFAARVIVEYDRLALPQPGEPT